MIVLPVVFLLGSAMTSSRATAQTSVDLLRETALKMKEPLDCLQWDCDCAFNRQLGCCCGANDLNRIEDNTFNRIKKLLKDMSKLSSKIHEVADDPHIAFTASLDPNIASQASSGESCFGPFNAEVPITYSMVTLQDGPGYNPSLGVFSAPEAGVYVFSFTVYASVGDTDRLYHKVQLVLNGSPVTEVWENNREDREDSATQVVLLKLTKGDNVYMMLSSGRKLCTRLERNVFTGYLLYPLRDDC